MLIHHPTILTHKSQWPLDEWKRTHHNQANYNQLATTKKTKPNKTQTKSKLKQHLLEQRPRTPLIGSTFRSSPDSRLSILFLVFITTKFLPFLLLFSFFFSWERERDWDFRKHHQQQYANRIHKSRTTFAAAAAAGAEEAFWRAQIWSREAMSSLDEETAAKVLRQVGYWWSQMFLGFLVMCILWWCGWVRV